MKENKKLLKNIDDNSLCEYLESYLLGNKIDLNKIESNSIILSSFLLGRSIQNDLEKGNKTLDMDKYLDIIDKGVLNQFDNHKYQTLYSYFLMIKDDINNFKNNIDIFSTTSKYFLNTSNVRRTGWLNMNIDLVEVESVAEHMYNAHLIGLIYLPEHYIDKEYNKDKILKMMLIHDIGESITGDIPQPEKELDQENFDFIENIEMQKLLLKGTYSRFSNLSEYISLWKDWEQNKNINSQIAKELDKIQMLYQLCLYVKAFKDNFSDESMESWLKSKNVIKTPIGKEIYKKLILDNKEFSDLVSRYGFNL